MSWAGWVIIALTGVCALATIVTWRGDEQALQTARQAYAAARDDFDAAIDADLAATREPGTLLVRLPRRIAKDPCGCLWFACGYWSPCDLHDPTQTTQVIGRWKDEMNL